MNLFLKAIRTTFATAASLMFFGLLVGAPMGCDHASHGTGDDHHADVQGPPTLNNGKRWVADEPTRSGMRALRQKVDSFAAAGKMAAKDQLALRAELQTDVGRIFKNCTMTGPGHTELHKYIALLLKDVEALGSGDVSSAPALIKKVQADILLFDRYFE